MIHFAFAYLFLCLVLAYFGRRRAMGFWGMFFGSIVMTPIIGFLILILTSNVKPKT
jgi:Zn-dependent protease